MANNRVSNPFNEGLAELLLQKKEAFSEKSETLGFVFQRAVKEVCKEKQPIRTSEDFLKVKYCGQALLKLVKKYLESIATSGDLRDTDEEEEAPKIKGKVSNGKKSPKLYVPRENSAAYALLIVLFRARQDGKEFMKKDELIDAIESSGLCRTSMRPDTTYRGPTSGDRMYYSGWNCMKILTKKELVIRWSNPALFMLTEAGFHTALDCMIRSCLLPGDHGIVWIPPATKPGKTPMSAVNNHSPSSASTSTASPPKRRAKKQRTTAHTTADIDQVKEAGCTDTEASLGLLHVSDMEVPISMSVVAAARPKHGEIRVEDANPAGSVPSMAANTGDALRQETFHATRQGGAFKQLFSGVALEESALLRPPAERRPAAVTTSASASTTYVETPTAPVANHLQTQPMQRPVAESILLRQPVECPQPPMNVSAPVPRRSTETLAAPILNSSQARSVRLSTPAGSTHRAPTVSSFAGTVLCVPPLRPGQRFADAYDVVFCVDSRETFMRTDKGTMASRVVENLRNSFKVDVVVRHLDVGDALWLARSKTHPSEEYVLDFIVERKRVDDMCQSIMGTRFKYQKLRLMNCGLKKLIYLVEGDPDQFDKAQNIKTGALQTEVEDGFDVQRTAHWVGEGSTVERYGHLTMAIRERYALEVGQTDSSAVPTALTFIEFQDNCKLFKETTVGGIFESFLSQISHVTEATALAIMEQYPTLAHLLEAYQTLDGNRKAQETLLTRISVNKKKVTPLVSKRIFETLWG